MPRTRVAIAGIGQTRYTKWGASDSSEFALACDAVQSAVHDSGLSLHAVDGFTSFGDEQNEPVQLQAALNVPRLRFSAMLWGGGGGGSCGAVALAIAAIRSGQAETVVVYRSLCQGQQGRFGQFDPQWPHASLLHPFGVFAAAQHLALVVRRHMHEYGTTQEQLGEFAIACREHAQRNPNAVMKDRSLDMQTYLSSRLIADPFHLYDCCLESDGACAVVVTSLERARDLVERPVEILAAVHGGGPGWETGPLGGHNQPLRDYPSSGAREVAKDLYRQAGVTARDIDVAQLYDNFTGMAMISLEDFGLCGIGDCGLFVEEGHTRWPDGRLPVNTHGGCLSEAYIHGLNHVVEGVRQIRGTSTAQVSDASLCLVSGGPGPSPTSGLILAKP